tara:strand:+ start:1000 stop:1644 length:645 start_codon:yes stop_codon:yes gene_type:complete
MEKGINTNIFVKHFKDNIEGYPINIFEIGADDARDSVIFYNEFNRSNIYAFEANVDTFNNNKSNINNINYINCAISDVEHDTVFYKKTEQYPGISSLRNRGQQYPGVTVTVKTKRIDTFCNENDITSIDICKVDVEGCTYEALKSFGDMLSKTKIFHIETETSQHFENQIVESEVFNLLKQHNFEMLQHEHCCLNQYDSVWINKMYKKDVTRND